MASLRRFLPGAAAKASAARISALEQETALLHALVKEERDRLSNTNAMLFELPDQKWASQLYERSKQRWVGDEDDLALTWGVELPGAPFVDILLKRDILDRPVDVLEVGPGWHRLMLAMNDAGAEVTSYTGVDLSAARVKRLTEAFGDETTKFVNSDMEAFAARSEYDLVISSLTFKHMFPSFEKSAEAIFASLRPGGVLAFDVPEGKNREFQHDQYNTYIRWYTREDVVAILEPLGYRDIDFDTVIYPMPGDPIGWSRLMVIARKP